MEVEPPVVVGAWVPRVVGLLVVVDASEQMEVELVVAGALVPQEVELVEAVWLAGVEHRRRHRLDYASQASQRVPPWDSQDQVVGDEHRLENLEHHQGTLGRHHHRREPRLQGSHEARVVDQPSEASASDLA